MRKADRADDERPRTRRCRHDEGEQLSAFEVAEPRDRARLVVSEVPASEMTASAASTPLRASVFQLAGAECSWPKQ